MWGLSYVNCRAPGAKKLDADEDIGKWRLQEGAYLGHSKGAMLMQIEAPMEPGGKSLCSSEGRKQKTEKNNEGAPPATGPPAPAAQPPSSGSWGGGGVST